jgi:ribonuclease-3
MVRISKVLPKVPLKVNSIKQLEASLGYTFNNIKLLERALVHRSYCSKHNERFEFLGDGLLNFIIAEYLFHHLPHLEEGELSNLRAHFVREEMLFEIALSFDLGNYLVLGVGERKTGGATRPSLLADGLEAIIAAIYQDAGFETSKQVILNLFKTRLNDAQKIKLSDMKIDFKDAKSKLQEHLQSLKKPLPEYDLVNTYGKDHEQQFEIACIVGLIKTIATGTSRKRAEREAATLMLEKLL